MSLTSDMWHYTVLLYHLGEQREQVKDLALGNIPLQQIPPASQPTSTIVIG